jgi:fucose 4-O-acetylase-like acetyltransferase
MSVSREEPDPRRSAARDATKGWMLLLIVLGHDSVLTARVPNLFPIVNNFHVLGFLLLPFVSTAPRASRALVVDRAVRYLVPYVVFALLATVAHRVLYSDGTTLSAWLLEAATAILRGNPHPLKHTTGFLAFWFLPALFSVTLLRSFVAELSLHWRVVVGLLLVVGHASLGIWPAWAREAVPMGFAAAVYVVPLGWTAAWVWKLAQNARPQLAVATAVGGLLCGVIAFRLHNSVINIGSLDVFGWNRPERLMLHDAYVLTTFLAAIAAGPWLARLWIVVQIGRHSLAVYLTHLFVIQIYALISRRFGFHVLGTLAEVAASVVFTIAGSLLAAQVCEWHRLRVWIMPRGAAEWPPTRRPAASAT